MVDDPFSFGQIAAANALSDIYAMGANPILAMNLLAFPSCLGLEVVREILEGGAAKVREAGAVIAGGHSIEDKEPKYGLSVTGTCNLAEVLTNDGGRRGDYLVLTKPLGTGILTTAAKVDLLTELEYKNLIQLMSTLNKYSADIGKKYAIHALTDITGFGLIGHALEMAGLDKCTLELWGDKIPIVPKAIELATMGIIPAGAYRNREHVGSKVRFEGNLPLAQQDVLFDPQTSGGLMFSIAPTEAYKFVTELKNTGIPAEVIGEIKQRGDVDIVVK